MPRAWRRRGREGRWAERRPPPEARGNLGPWELPNRESHGLWASLGSVDLHLSGHRRAGNLLKAWSATLPTPAGSPPPPRPCRPHNGEAQSPEVAVPAGQGGRAIPNWFNKKKKTGNVI